MEREFFKPRKEGVYLHVYNHTVSIEKGCLPLGDREKNKLIHIAEKYLVKYNIDLISFIVMGNHFHALLYCRPEKFDNEEARQAYNKFHQRKALIDSNHIKVKKLMAHSNNFSEYMREIQREFSVWFNKSRSYRRKGALWQDRFQCQLIQSDVYLWACLKYIEMNPVRAKICRDPEDYAYSSFGRWQEKHPYPQSFSEHIISIAERDISPEEFKDYMKKEMHLLHMRDRIRDMRSLRTNEAQKLEKELQQENSDSEIIIFTFAKKDWTSGKVLGSKDYIRQKYREWQMYKSSA